MYRANVSKKTGKFKLVRRSGNVSCRKYIIAFVTNWQELLRLTESIAGSDTIMGPSSGLRETVTYSVKPKEFRIARA